MDNGNRRSDNFGMLAGCAILVVGVVLMMDTLDIHYFREIFRYWPVALIALGLSKALDSQRV